MIETLATAAFMLAALPLVLTLLNLAFYRAPRQAAAPGTPVSILIPARNEATTITAAVEAALASEAVDLEVVVLDDHSTDGTDHVVAAIARRDPRLRLVYAPPLPAGWSGKQHACYVLAARARHDVLIFQDADVRLAPAAARRLAGTLLAGRAGLISGFPRQETGSLGEALLVPMMLFLLLGYLPIAGTRFTRLTGFGAACGQLIAVRREAYRCAGGHATIRASLHDGLKLPRAFRQAGVHTDLIDATDLATCRMYRGWSEAWQGFSKNATEGMATPHALPVWTVLLFGGHILPWLLLPVAVLAGEGLAPAAGAVAASFGLRLLLTFRFRQPGPGVLLHPVAVLLVLAIQWAALIRSARGRPSEWRGRSYTLGSG